MQLNFRKAVPADAPQMGRLLTLAWRKAYRGILSDALLDARSAEEGSGRIRTGIETKPDFRYFVLEAGRKIAGVSVVCPCADADLPGTAEIMVFYIHPDDQGKGLGKTMMEYTLADIRSAGGSRVALWVLKENHGARAFYEHMGFWADGAEKAMPHLENALAVRYQYGIRG